MSANLPSAYHPDGSSHQKKALTFMKRREQGWHHDGSQEDLWAKELDEAGQVTLVLSFRFKIPTN